MSDGREVRKDGLTGSWVLFGSWLEGGADFHLDPDQIPADRRCAVVPAEPLVLDRRVRAERSRDEAGLHQRQSAAGEHEVVLETRDAAQALADLDPEHMAELLGLYKARMLELRDDQRFRQLVVSKAEGALAGARSRRAYSEIFALSFVPDVIRQRLVQLQGHHRRTGACLLCAELKEARAERGRFVAETLHHMAFAPFASRRPFELMLLPKGHHPDYVAASELELADLAQLLLDVLGRLRRALERPAFRMTLFTAPLDAGADLGSFHWHLEIVPVLPLLPSALAGVVDFNPVPPEAAAAHYRGAQPE